MHLKTEGLVLRQTNYQDHDLLLTVLTKDYGRMTLRARGVKGKRSKLKSGCQLLAYAEFTIFENRRRRRWSCSCRCGRTWSCSAWRPILPRWRRSYPRRICRTRSFSR